MSYTVLFKGPKTDDNRGVTVLSVEAGGTGRDFPLGVKVEDVPESVVKELRKRVSADDYDYEVSEKSDR